MAVPQNQPSIVARGKMIATQEKCSRHRTPLVVRSRSPSRRWVVCDYWWDPRLLVSDPCRAPPSTLRPRRSEDEVSPQVYFVRVGPTGPDARIRIFCPRKFENPWFEGRALTRGRADVGLMSALHLEFAPEVCERSLVFTVLQCDRSASLSELRELSPQTPVCDRAKVFCVKKR